MSDRVRDEDGFSLTEVAVTCALLMVLLIPMLRFFESSVSGAVDLQTSTQQHADARVTMDQLVRELRQAYTGDPALSPVTVTAQALTVYSPDTSTPFHLRRIDYRLQANRLQRAVAVSTGTSGAPWAFGPTGPWVPVMDARVADAFTAVTVGAAIRRVDIALTGLNARNRADRPFRTSVELRNV
jgi:type II secretory pathway component PulJ